MKKKRNLWKLILGAGLLVFVLIQFIPIERTNPPVETDIAAPKEIDSILRRSCYDCHSNETVYPWYAYLAPASWLMRYDINEGREHLNFSTWNRYDAKKRAHQFEEIVEVIEEGEMPLPIYLPLHPEAKLSPQDEKALIDWAKGEMARLPQPEE